MFVNNLHYVIIFYLYTQDESLNRKNISTSRQLIKNVENFLSIHNYFYFKKFSSSSTFYGWGRKKSGLKAVALSKKYQTTCTLLEDGFIRSLDLGLNNSPSFSLVEDDIGIYYDATAPSKLENILSAYDFNSDDTLIKTATNAMSLIKKHHISKYNNAPDINDDFFKSDTKSKVLIVAQTAGDASLEYGLAEKFSTKKMIEDALQENPNASVYIKIHPDVLVGKKESDISMDDIPTNCTVLDEDVNPISLLKHFDKVYTKTSGMGMEALVLGLEVICYGMPYYAGWGLTQDKQHCERRKRELSVTELFTGSYILYTRYYNPYKKRPSDIIDTIEEIIKQKKDAII